MDNLTTFVYKIFNAKNNIIFHKRDKLKLKEQSKLIDTNVFDYSAFKFKDDYSNMNLEKVLNNMGFEKTQIRNLISEFQEIGYFLEMDDLDIVSLKDLQASDGLYERNFVKML
jgi:hypothetical protein